MRELSVLILPLLLLAISCKPSARFRSNQDAPAYKSNLKESSHLNDYVSQWLNSPYKYSGMSKSGVDCSGFSTRVMQDVYGIKLPRTAEMQYENGQKLSDGKRKAGDLVFFRNVRGRGRGIDHVGVFLGDNKFAHASASAGVVISDLDEDYYQERYVGACRYFK